jgi:hypothetical protein
MLRSPVFYVLDCDDVYSVFFECKKKLIGKFLHSAGPNIWRYLFETELAIPAFLGRKLPARQKNVPRLCRKTGLSRGILAWLLCLIRRSLLSELLGEAPAFSNHLISGDRFALSRFDAPDSFLKNGQKYRMVLVKA